MNRVQKSNKIEQSQSHFDFEMSLTFQQDESKQEQRTEHSLLGPLHYEKKYAYPLLIWMHDKGTSHQQLHKVIPKISLRNYVAIAPKSANQTDPWSQDGDSIYATEKVISDCISAASEQYNVDANRIFIAGHGVGGTMAFRMALNHPDWFAGTLSFGGALPENQTPLIDIKRARKIPFFVSHGRDSKKFQTEQLCDHLRLMYFAGFDVTVRQYPEGDDLQPFVLNDMNRWMMEIVTGQDSTEPAPQNNMHSKAYRQIGKN